MLDGCFNVCLGCVWVCMVCRCMYGRVDVYVWVCVVSVMYECVWCVVCVVCDL